MRGLRASATSGTRMPSTSRAQYRGDASHAREVICITVPPDAHTQGTMTYTASAAARLPSSTVRSMGWLASPANQLPKEAPSSSADSRKNPSGAALCRAGMAGGA